MWTIIIIIVLIYIIHVVDGFVKKWGFEVGSTNRFVVRMCVYMC